MTRHDHEPLTPEERALADRLARLGPHGGPPPTLDAKILAAAHAAVARTPRRNRRRWLGLSGGAGGLVTGLGLAASLTLVLGVVWQLRPGDKALPQMGEGEAEHVILVDALPSSEPRTRIVEPPAAEPAAAAAPASAPASTQSVPPAPADMAGARRSAGQAPPPPAQEMDAESKREAAGPEARDQASAQAKAAPYRDEAPRPAQDDAVPATAPTAFPASATAERAPSEPAADASRRATYTHAARAQAERVAKRHAEEELVETQRALPEAPAAYSPPAPLPAPAVAADAADNAAGASAAGIETESATLDRIEVTGSRIRSAEVAAIPLHEDASLAPGDWLERIRARQAAGDVDTARESLRLFRKAHPRVRLPDDLRDLLASPDGNGPDAP